MIGRRPRRRLGIALAGGAAVLALGVGTALAADAPVAISGFAFTPPSVTVTVGDSVTWTNGDGVGHTATADDASFDTGTIAAGGSGSVTFATAGTFAYHCSIHPAMTGTVTVQAAAGGGGATPAATTPPTDAAAIAAIAEPPAASSAGWIALVVVVGGWFAGLVAARRHLVRERLANQSWTDSSATEKADVETR